MLETLKNRIAGVVASRHIAGTELADALVVCDWARRQNISTVISPWAQPGDSPRDMLRHYSEAVVAIRKEDIDSHLAVKLSAIDYDMGIFDELAGTARANNVRVHVDSLGPETASRSLAFLEKAAANYSNLGCTLPSRWQRSISDAERAAELGLHVRIVKGQWADPDAPRLDCRKQFLTIASKLAGSSSQVSVATHDYSLAQNALNLLSHSTTGFEVEQFFSLPRNGLELSRRFACTYRIYVAYRGPSMPYNWHFFLSRPSMLAWILYDFAAARKKPWANESPHDIQ
jgi:proline dehydrogenase